MFLLVGKGEILGCTVKCMVNPFYQARKEKRAVKLHAGRSRAVIVRHA